MPPKKARAQAEDDQVEVLDWTVEDPGARYALVIEKEETKEANEDNPGGVAKLLPKNE